MARWHLEVNPSCHGLRNLIRKCFWGSSWCQSRKFFPGCSEVWGCQEAAAALLRAGCVLALAAAAPRRAAAHCGYCCTPALCCPASWTADTLKGLSATLATPPINKMFVKDKSKGLNVSFSKGTAACFDTYLQSGCWPFCMSLLLSCLFKNRTSSSAEETINTLKLSQFATS